ncbi:MAG: NADH-quinone oxidoreductase subunit L [Dongiaceae bacterium]
MTSPLAWLLLLAPLAPMLAAAATARAASPAAAARLGTAAAAAGLAVAIGGAGAVAALGTLDSGTIGIAGIGISVYCDALGAVMLCLVALVGFVVLAFSRNYLDGDPGHRRFTRWLCLTLAAVLLLVLSGNLLQLVAAWICTSLALHRLLVFYPDRPGAVLAARKKFVVSRAGDLCLIAALVLVYHAFGSLDLATVLDGAAALHRAGGQSGAAAAAALLVALGAMLKSAQLPVHGWLLEVMETPTPVSALLHAGIINAGGFLVLRLAGLVTLSGTALDLLAIVGGLTALLGSLVMLTQSAVKQSLAWSTIGQMGFMMLQCGLGAFPAALLHIVAHSLYKAHAFLSAGSAAERGAPRRVGLPRPRSAALAAVVLLTLALAAAAALGASPLDRPAAFALVAILLLGASMLVAAAGEAGCGAGRSAIFAAIVLAGYGGLQLGALGLVGGVLPPAPPRGAVGLIVAALTVAGFAGVAILQGVPPHRRGAWGTALHIHLLNGLYLNTLANRLVARWWPKVAPQGASA